MNDIAAEAGLSRQTLYDLFGGKDELMRAAIRLVKEESWRAIGERLGACSTLREKLNVYFEETVLKSFEMLQSAGDPEDLIGSHNKAGMAELEVVRKQERLLVADILSDHGFPGSEDRNACERLANFIVVASMHFKHVNDKSELDELLLTLSDSVRAITGVD